MDEVQLKVRSQDFYPNNISFFKQYVQPFRDNLYNLRLHCNSVHLLDNSDLPNNLSPPFLQQQECYIVQKLCIKCFIREHNKEAQNMKSVKISLLAEQNMNFFCNFCGEKWRWPQKGRKLRASSSWRKPPVDGVPNTKYRPVVGDCQFCRPLH